eukprot:Anaeramoba_ignava/a94147_329.p1 GENE.a94147_329~~a94147_329.p1  ORF type:complete len:114 (+),score=28.55 a94147_329:86-427(+)
MTSGAVQAGQAVAFIYGFLLGVYGIIKYLRDKEHGMKFLIGGIGSFVYFFISFIVSVVHSSIKAGLIMSVIGLSVFLVLSAILVIRARSIMNFVFAGITLICWIIAVVAAAKA